jgi:DNA polymerase-3 subunit gamma/tau
VTILSRCLQFNLKRLPVSLIVSHLQHVLTEEKIEHNITALQLLAEAADGSMRDALSLLDQALAFGAGAVREQEVRDMLGTVSRDKVIDLLEAVLSRNAAQAMQHVAALSEFAPDYEDLLSGLLSLLHHMSIAKTVPDALDEFISARERLLALSETVSTEDLQLFYQIALIGRRDLALSPDARQGFEMVMLRMLAFRPADAAARPAQSGSAEQPVSTQDPAVSSAPVNTQHTGSKDRTPAPVSSTEQASKQAGQQESSPVPKKNAGSAVRSKVSEPPADDLSYRADRSGVEQSGQPVVPSTDWIEVAQSLVLGGLVKQLALNCTMKDLSGDNIVLQIASGHANLVNPKAKLRLQQALGEYYNIDARLEIEVVEKANAESPAQTQQREIRQRQQQAERAIDEDSFTRSLKETFDAELVPGSVKPVS